MEANSTEKRIIVIRTLECDLCRRFDSILLADDEVRYRAYSNELKIGSHIINHGDHLRIAYFDEFGSYLGDTISLSVKQEPLLDLGTSIPIFKVRSDQSHLKRLGRKILNFFVSESIELTIVGPSMAGKTSLALFLETGIPERYSKRVEHAPTMVKSVKRIKLGRSDLTIFDMGGQQDFWDKWVPIISASKKIIFVMDGTANNETEVVQSLNLVLEHRTPDTQIMILINKLDLLLDGYTSDFMQLDKITSHVEGDLENTWFLKSSVFNGTAYMTKEEEETDLAPVIHTFLSR